MYKKAYLSFGSNIGNSIDIIKKAYSLLEKSTSIKINKVSNFYKTSPVSDIKQRYYINSAIEIVTTLSPEELFQKTECIEESLGKKKKPKNMPRKIDIDILFYENIILKNETLIIPHPLWGKRLFVLIPLSELIKKIYYPQLKKNIYLTSIIKKLKITNNDKVDIIKKL